VYLLSIFDKNGSHEQNKNCNQLGMRLRIIILTSFDTSDYTVSNAIYLQSVT